MQELNCTDMTAYLELIARNKTVRRDCELKMTVSISRFLRDRQLWVDLQSKILPAIIENHPRSVRTWSAGCGRGEEVYSLKIIWERMKQTDVNLPLLEITGTDKHPDYIQKARAGVYNNSSLKEVSPEIQKCYFDFQKRGQRCAVKPTIKAGINWKVQDIFTEPPGTGFDIIFLRNNLLTYYRETLQKKGLSQVVKALATDGWLIVGSHEKLPSGLPKFWRDPCTPWAYRHQG
jgi:chemotaxis methyl-accepting protein methylase